MTAYAGTSIYDDVDGEVDKILEGTVSPNSRDLFRKMTATIVEPVGGTNTKVVIALPPIVEDTLCDQPGDAFRIKMALGREQTVISKRLGLAFVSCREGSGLEEWLGWWDKDKSRPYEKRFSLTNIPANRGIIEIIVNHQDETIDAVRRFEVQGRAVSSGGR